MDWGTVKGESEQLFLCNKNILHCLGQPGNPQQQIQKRNNPTALLGMHARMHTHQHSVKLRIESFVPTTGNCKRCEVRTLSLWIKYISSHLSAGGQV